MIVAEDSRDLPPQIDKCFDLTHCCVRVRQEPGSRVWETSSPLGHNENEEYLLIPQKDVESTFFTVYGITEIFGHTPQSDNEELLGFLVLLKNGYYLHIRIMWEASFPYQITLQKFPTYTAKSGQSFGYAQNMRFKFALLGGKIAQNADGAKFTILNQTLLGKKKQVLEVISLRQHNGMDSFRHTLKRTLNSYVQDFSNATPLEL